MVLILAISVVLSGCSSSKGPKDALEGSISKMSGLNSYAFSGNFKLDELDIADDTEQGAIAMNVLKNSEISWTGVYQKDPAMTELTLKLDLKGDFSINLSIPMIVTEKKIWVKIPNAAMLGIPEELVGKYIELDLEDLAAQSGQSIKGVDVTNSQKFSQDIMAIVFKHIDQNAYLSSVKTKDAALPEALGVKQVVQFHIEKSQLESFITTVVEKIAPEVVELLSKNADYRELFGLTEEQIDEAKDSLATAKSDLSNNIADLKNGLTKFDILAVIGIDKNEYPVYTDATVKFGGESEEFTGSIAMKVITQLTKVNEKVTFEYGEPASADIIPFEEMFGDLGGLMGGFSSDY